MCFESEAYQVAENSADPEGGNDSFCPWMREVTQNWGDPGNFSDKFRRKARLYFIPFLEESNPVKFDYVADKNVRHGKGTPIQSDLMHRISGAASAEQKLYSQNGNADMLKIEPICTRPSKPLPRPSEWNAVKIHEIKHRVSR